MWIDYFKLAFKTFKSEKKRTALTLIGIFIGIAAVVSLISLGQGLKASIDRQFDLLGTDKIFIQPGNSIGFDPTMTIKLSDEDLQAIRNTRGVDSAGAMVFKLARAEYKGTSKFVFVMGMDDPEVDFAGLIESFGVEIEEGRGAESAKEAVIGRNFVNGELFDISNDELDFIYVTVSKSEEPATVAERLKKALRNTHDVDEGDEDFTVSTTDDYMETFGIILTVVQIVLIGIAGISLLVGGVNIANTMYTSVLERTNEIGIMKAIGARNSDVFLLFLVESGILGAVGGLVGIAAGIGLSKLVVFAAASTGWTFIQTSFPWYLTFGALIFSFGVGAIAGTLPAYQASKLKPVDALRYE